MGEWMESDANRHVTSTGVGAALSATPSGADLTINVANLRAAFAYDKMLRLSVAAGDGDYGSQIQAHYGFNAVHDDWKSQFIGGCTSAVNYLNDVTY